MFLRFRSTARTGSAAGASSRDQAETETGVSGAGEVVTLFAYAQAHGQEGQPALRDQAQVKQLFYLGLVTWYRSREAPSDRSNKTGAAGPAALKVALDASVYSTVPYNQQGEHRL